MCRDESKRGYEGEVFGGIGGMADGLYGGVFVSGDCGAKGGLFDFLRGRSVDSVSAGICLYI